MGSKVYWNCLIGSMAEQISILHMEVNFQFVEMNHCPFSLEGFRLRGFFVYSHGRGSVHSGRFSVVSI